MFICAFLLLFLLPVALLPIVLEGLCSDSELTEMGIRLEPSQAGDPV
jgi:hypothetical protein